MRLLLQGFIVSPHDTEEQSWILNSISGTHAVITARKLLAGGNGVGGAGLPALECESEWEEDGCV